MRHVIECNRFTAFPQMSKQPVLSLNHVEHMVVPAELELDAVANATQTRCLFTNEQRTVLPNLPEKCGFADARWPYDQGILAQRM